MGVAITRLDGGCTSAAAALAHTTKATATHAHVDAYNSHGLKVPVIAPYVKGSGGEKSAVKEETHAARWGLLRGYSGKATKWVDFVVTDSTRRESCHFHRVVRNGDGVKGKLEKRVLGRVRFRELENRAGITRVGFRPSRCEV